MELLDLAGRSPHELAQALQSSIINTTESPRSSTPSRPSAPGRRSCSSTSTAKRPRPRAVRLSDLFVTLQANLDSLYVNDFNLFGRTYRVFLQAGGEAAVVLIQPLVLVTDEVGLLLDELRSFIASRQVGVHRKCIPNLHDAAFNAVRALCSAMGWRRRCMKAPSGFSRPTSFDPEPSIGST